MNAHEAIETMPSRFRLLIATSANAASLGRIAIAQDICDAVVYLEDRPGGGAYATWWMTDRGTDEDRRELLDYITALIKRAAEIDGCVAVDVTAVPTPRASA